MFAKSCSRLSRIFKMSHKTKDIGLILNQAIRLQGGGRQCAPDDSPRCSPENLAKSPCFQAKRKEKVVPIVEFKSMWDNPECCKDPCPDVLPRFDELYYKRSDKAKRLYRQTWTECPELRVRKKVVCCYEQMRLPPLERRPRKCVSAAACPRKDPTICRGRGDHRCPKTTMPCCPGARDPPKCKVTREKSNCTKICAPYPSYSECKHPHPKPLHPKECRCLIVESMCDVWAEFRKMSKFKK